MLTGICNWNSRGPVGLAAHVRAVKASFTDVARHRRQRQLPVTFSEKHSKSASSRTSIDTLDLLLSSDDPSPEDTFDETARASVAEILDSPEKQADVVESSALQTETRQQPDASTSAPSPEALMEALMARKLTTSMVVQASKAAAQKWIKDKTTPKQSLLAAFGAEDHGVMAQPFLSYGVLVVNLAVYLAGLGVRFSLGESSGESYFYGLAKVNDEVVQGEYYRLVTSAFLHDSFSHLALNTYALYTVAPEVEAVLGHWSFLSVYLLSGLAGSSAAFVFGDTITVGASTCIFGLIGGLGGYMWKNRAVNQSSDQLLSIAGIAAISLALGWSDETTVDNLGHIVGGLTGILLGWAIGPTLLPAPEQEGSSDTNKPKQDTLLPSSAMQMQNLKPAESGMPRKPMQRRIDPMDGIRRVSISTAFLAVLISIVASTVIDRVGHLPTPKGLGL